MAMQWSWKPPGVIPCRFESYTHRRYVYAPVAQWILPSRPPNYGDFTFVCPHSSVDRASSCGAEGRRFKSSWGRWFDCDPPFWRGEVESANWRSEIPAERAKKTPRQKTRGRERGEPLRQQTGFPLSVDVNPTDWLRTSGDPVVTV